MPCPVKFGNRQSSTVAMGSVTKSLWRMQEANAPVAVVPPLLVLVVTVVTVVAVLAVVVAGADVVAEVACLVVAGAAVVAVVALKA